MRMMTTIFGFGMAALLLGACDDVTMPEGMAAVDVEAQGDGSQQGSDSATASGSSGAENSGEVEGTVEFRARMWVRTTAGEWVEVTGGAAKQVIVDARQRGNPKHYFSAHVESETYNRVRVEFEEVKARATGGAAVSADLVGVDLRVDLGGSGKAVVEQSLDLRADAGSRSRLVIDLNASQWMSRVNTTTRAAARADFESAVRIYTR